MPAPNAPLRLTRQQEIQTIVKCGKDPVFFINNYVKIQHPGRGVIPFDTYPFQDDCVKAFQDHRWNVVLKSRQLGLSTITAAFALWLAIFHKDKAILVIATKLPTAVNFIKKVKVMWLNLPKWLLITDLANDTRQELVFKCGSSIKAIPTSSDAGRSEALSLLIVDEAAFIDGFDDLWTGLAPTIQVAGNCIIISTPNGIGGQYYNIWTQARAGDNGFNPIELKWDVHPEHDDDWFKEQEKIFNHSRKKIAQELLCDFVGSGDTFLQPDEVDFLKVMVKPPIKKDPSNHGIWIWEDPKPGHNYVMSADVARGDSKDFSTFHIIDSVECEVVVEFKGKVAPDKLAEMMIEYGNLYNKALAVPENNSFGYHTAMRMKNENYSRMFYENSRPGYVPIDGKLPGFNTQKNSRPMILSKLEELIRNKIVKIYSERFLHEITTFVWVGSRAQASKDSNDDLVISLAIGLWVIDTVIGFRHDNFEMIKCMLSASSISRREASTLPGATNVRPLVNPKLLAANMNRPQSADVYASRFGEGLNDFSWLLK